MRQSWNLRWKRFCAGAAAFCVAAGLFAPQQAVLADEEAQAAMGRYVEEQLTLPENFFAYDIVRTAEETLRMFGNDGSGYVYLDSGDGGETWEESGRLPDEYAEEYFTEAVLNPNGGAALIQWVETGETEYEYVYLTADKDGNVQEMPGQEGLEPGYLHFSRNGTLLLNTYNGEVFVLDAASGERTPVAPGPTNSIGTCGNEVLLLTDAEVQRYDYTTAEPLTRDEVLDEALYADGFSPFVVSSFGGPIAMTEDEEGRLSYVNNNGIYTHNMGGSVVEQVADGNLCRLSDPSMVLMGMAALEQRFYVLAMAGGSDNPCLLRYVYDETVAGTPQTELTVWSLRENDTLRQMAVLFQQKYPDVYVNYKTGMSGEDGVTASDALRTLNTDILAGNGPDVMLLDELSVDTYTEQGLLADLSGLVSQIKESEGMLENVADAYAQDGVLPAVPARFGLLVTIGDPAAMEQINGLDSIAELASQPGTLAPYDINSMAEILYRTCSGSWKNEDGTIQQERLAEYVSGVKKIVDTWKENATDEKLEELSKYEDGTYTNWIAMEGYGDIVADDAALYLLDLLTEEDRVRFGSLNEIVTYSGLTTVNKETGACEIRLAETQQSDVFLPYCVLGILNTAREREAAEDFVAYALSAEGQEASSSVNGFPVNRQVFEKYLYTPQWDEEDGGYSLGASGEDGTMVELNYVWPTQEELDALYEMAKSVITPADLERVQHDAVMDEMERCLSGETTADEATNAIIQKLNLYLAE